jgi:hypothetical protein
LELALRLVSAAAVAMSAAGPLRAAALRLRAPPPAPCSWRARPRAPAAARRALSSASQPPPSPPAALSAAELRAAARSARLADHVYADAEAQTAALVAADGMAVVAQGRSAATRWLVADDAAHGVRHVVFRGVAWRDEAVDRTALTMRLAQAWPARCTPRVRRLPSPADAPRNWKHSPLSLAHASL